MEREVKRTIFMPVQRSLHRFLFCLLVFLFAVEMIGGEPKNLALGAKASASLSAKGHGAFYSYDSAEGDPSGLTHDGNLESSLSFPPDQLPEAWLSLSWPKPVTFREVLIRQHLHLKLDQLSLQVKRDGAWKTAKTISAGATPMAKLILITVEPQTTDAIRLTDFKGEPRIYEVEVYEGPSAPVINLSGDAAGHVIGIVTDAFGAAPLTRVPVTLSGRAGEKPWKASSITDDHGMFNIGAPTGLHGKVRAAAQVGLTKIEQEVEAGDLPLRLTPPNSSEPGINLNGEWKFATDPPQDFFRPEFRDPAWSSIEVPAHWVMKGFKSRAGYVFQVALLDRAIGKHARIAEVHLKFIDRKSGISKMLQVTGKTLLEK